MAKHPIYTTSFAGVFGSERTFDKLQRVDTCLLISSIQSSNWLKLRRWRLP